MDIKPKGESENSEFSALKPVVIDEATGNPVSTDTPQPESTVINTNKDTVVINDEKKSLMPVSRKLSKKQIMIISGVAAVLGLGALGYFLFSKPTPTPVAKKIIAKKVIPKPTTVASTLSGLQVDPSANARPVTGVMVENSTDARPQSGLDQASVMFEAIAEGGITRFLALFQDTAPDYIGPVRSARPYYVQWCMGFDCALAHAGGSPEALADIRSWGAKDLDQFANGGAYQRVSNRYAPHNLYSSIAKLNELETAKGFGTPTFTGFTRKPEAKSKTPNAKSVNINISSFNFNSHYDYDASTNSYKRSQAGAPHMTVDGSGKQLQIAPKVIVALAMPYGVAADKHSSYGAVGNGQGLVFQDGIATQVNWSKSDTSSPIVLTGADGQPFGLNAGQTWVVALSALGLATYQ